MTVYIGYMAGNESSAAEADVRVRAGGAFFTEWAMERVRTLRENPPAGLKIHASFIPRGIGTRGYTAAQPGIIVVETDDDSHLDAISNNYAGLLHIVWAPGSILGGSAEEAEAMLARQ